MCGRSFIEDATGDVAMIFGLMAIVMVLFVGGAVDMGRWLHARSQTLAAMDAAVLAGARVMQLDSSDTAGAMESAMKFYAENVATRIPVENDTIAFHVTDDGKSVTASGNAYIRTPFMSLASVERLPLIDQVGAEYPKAELAVGGNAEQDVEISIMLDVTGSMKGQKLADMKAAAKDLIDIVIWDDQTVNYSKVALVPFAEAVNVGLIAPQVANNMSSTASFGFNNGWTRTWNLTPECVSERTTSKKFTDDAPNGAHKVGRVYTQSGACTPTNVIVPLSNNKAMLKSTIDSFVANGATAGHLGTAWAWYMLSPNWGNVLGPASRPADYSGLTTKGPKGLPKLRKVAILMTDGDYNVQYCSTGIRDKYSNGNNSQKGSCTANNGSSTYQARQLCTAMKAKGITVYTIGFDISSGSTAAATLQQCASSDQTFYMASNGEQLRQAFRDIALQISTLYLSR
ncbi:MAG: Tad domain-containing protein [Pseudomonadota bacterium]